MIKRMCVCWWWGRVYAYVTDVLFAACDYMNAVAYGWWRSQWSSAWIMVRQTECERRTRRGEKAGVKVDQPDEEREDESGMGHIVWRMIHASSG